MNFYCQLIRGVYCVLKRISERYRAENSAARGQELSLDDFSSLDAFCDDFQVARDEIEEKLASIDYEYDEELNKFV